MVQLQMGLSHHRTNMELSNEIMMNLKGAIEKIYSDGRLRGDVFAYVDKNRQIVLEVSGQITVLKQLPPQTRVESGVIRYEVKQSGSYS